MGQSVAQRLIERGDPVWGTTRSPERAQKLEALGIEPVIADWLEPDSLRRLPPMDRMLIATSYDRRSQLDRFDFHVGGLGKLLDAVGPDIDVGRTGICYISTTGVYHQSDGSWVDEDSPTEPTREAGQAHLQAEQRLRRLPAASRWVVLRLAGIYGTGRVPRVNDVVNGRPIASPQHGFLNLIHVLDAAEAVIASWQNASQRLYVVSDDQPVNRGEFYREVARQSGVSEPVFVDPDPDSSVARRSESNKRVSNRRMKRDLIANLRYPTYREGLASVLGGQV